MQVAGSEGMDYVASLLKPLGHKEAPAHRLLGVGLRRLGYRRLPSFLIVGTQKGGTHALRRYLAAHPLIVGPKSAHELHFFEQDRLYRRGVEWYSRWFPTPITLRGKQTFDATSEYMYFPGAARRIRHHLPAAKLIVLLREPISRAFSAWNMFRQFHAILEQVEPIWRLQLDAHVLEAYVSFASRTPFPDFATAVGEELTAGEAEDCVLPGFVHRGFYDDQLARIFAVFPREQVFVVQSEMLRSYPSRVLDQVVEFLGLPRNEWRHDLFTPHHVGKYVDKIQPTAQSLLQETYSPHNRRLVELLGVDFGWDDANLAE